MNSVGQLDAEKLAAQVLPDVFNIRLPASLFKGFSGHLLKERCSATFWETYFLLLKKITLLSGAPNFPFDYVSNFTM